MGLRRCRGGPRRLAPQYDSIQPPNAVLPRSNHARDEGVAALFRNSWLRLPELAQEPGLSRFPVPHDGLRRHVQYIRGLFDVEAAKEPQFDDLAHTGVEHGQRAKCIT